MNRSVVIIGSGFAGLSAACFLAKKGYCVTVLEKNSTAGGRCRVWRESGYSFDLGPSWYWMPDVFEDFFSHFGKKINNYYELKKLNPSYKIFYKEDVWKIPTGAQAVGEFLERYEIGAAENLKKFLKGAEYKYNTGMRRLVLKPGKSLLEFADWRLAAGLLKLDVFSNMEKHVGRYFKDPRIRQLMEFPVLFLGAKPSKTPALYSLMNYADIQLGTWYPMGGMYKIVEAMQSLGEELGVKFRFNTEVTKIRTAGKTVCSVETPVGEYLADVVIAGADYHHVDSKLLNGNANYTEDYWQKRTLAPSSLIYYLGVKKKIEGLEHHNLFFDEDFGRHAREIYDNPSWPGKPLFYVSATSKTDPSVAPAGHENLFILIPVAPGLDDTDEIRERYFNVVISRMEERTGQSIAPYIEVKRSYAHRDFIADYYAFKGNAYGLANTLRQTALLKPALKNRNLTNFYYTGQLTVPGPGVPPSLISGRVVASEVQKDFPLTLK